MEKLVLTENNLRLNASFQDKWEAIAACGQILVDQGYVTREYLEDMYERERAAGVYIGNHVAIPHGIEGSIGHIIHSGISFVQIPEGVKFGEETAYVMIGIAGKDGTHIEILKQIALVCMDLEKVEKLRTAKDTEEVLQILKQIAL